MAGYINTTGKLLAANFVAGVIEGASGQTASKESGVGLYLPGAIVAAGVSWFMNHSLAWMFVHMLLSWFYVAFKVVAYFAGW